MSSTEFETAGIVPEPPATPAKPNGGGAAKSDARMNGSSRPPPRGLDAAQLLPDRETISTFVDCLFRYANKDAYVNLRAFDDLADDRPPLFIEPVKVGDPNFVDRVSRRIAEAANHARPHVFAPPICSFKTPGGAKASDLAEGIALSVEVDEQPTAAKQTLTALLGPATCIVASGGIWRNTDTGENEEKIHLHWRLATPTRTPEEHALLREARELATRLVCGDATSIAIVHPMRWPGSWHRKQRPRLARLVANPGIEINLDEVLERLRRAVGQGPSEQCHDEPPPKAEPNQRAGARPEADPLKIVAWLAAIPNEHLSWDEWNRVGMASWRASGGMGFAAFDAWSQKSSKYNEQNTKARWVHYSTSPPGRISAGTLAHLAKEAASAQRDVNAWDDPDWSILDDRRGKLPEFPVDVLSPACQEWLLQAAHGAGVTSGHVAVPLLTSSSSLIGTARRVRASPTWSEPMTTWTAVLGYSGSGKTPGLDVIRRALSQIARDRKPKLAELQRDHTKRAEKAKAENKKWKKEVEGAIANGQPVPTMSPEAVLLAEFVAPRLVVSDITIERMAVLLEVRPRGMLRITDELAGVFLNMGRYSGGQDNEFWLEAWDGKHFVVERQGRPPVEVDYLLVGLTGGFQPDKLSRSFEGDHDGMYARFLFAWPEEPAYRALATDGEEIAPELINALTRTIDLPAEDEGVFVPRDVSLSSDALQEFEQFRQYLHEHKAELDGRARDWWAKGATHVLRLSGTLAYLAWSMHGGPEPTQIEAEFVRAAVRLVREYFWPHSLAALRQIGLSERHANARRVLRWVRAKGRAEVSREDIRRDALGQNLDAEQTQALIDGLVKAGWLRPKPANTPSPSGGRPRHRWDVNPKLFDAAETVGNAETLQCEAVPAASAVSATENQEEARWTG